ncbi:hypothetical protein FGIG_04045 [Fasciola gigantica]|uniref:Uncharacterized protein n=1 Tax=Fasciola gigantica TaxID=46835 RepID=A0A504YBK9_FASGI|nr:hypothetical protein FGIG_04045 [Fasciola gigantica]
MMKTNEPTTMLTSSETSAVNGTERVGQETTLFVSSGATTIGNGKVNTIGIGSTAPSGTAQSDSGSVKCPTVVLSSPSGTVIGANYTTMSSEQSDNPPTYSSTIGTKSVVSSTTTMSSQPIDYSLLNDSSNSDGAVYSSTSESSSETFFNSNDRSTQSFSKPISELPPTERVTTNYFRISTSRKITGFDYSTSEQQRSATHTESSTTQSHVDLTVTHTESATSPSLSVSNTAYKSTTKPTVSITREQLKTPERFLAYQTHSKPEHFTSPIEGGISGNRVEMELINPRESVGASSFGYAIPMNTAFANGTAIKSMDTERVAPYATATTVRIIHPSEPVFASTSQSSQPPDYWDKTINGSELHMIDDGETLDDTNDTRDYQVSTFLREPKS